jgi:type II secretory pathway pseudopilin PulG
MKCLPKFRDQNGFSILEVVIASGLLSLLTYAFLAQTSMQQKTMNAWDSKLEANDVKTSIAILLSNSRACNQAFATKTQTGTTSIIYRAERSSGGVWTTNAVYEVDPNKLINNTLYLESVQLEPSTTGAGAIPPNNQGELRVALRMVFVKDVIGGKNVTRYVQLKVETDGAGNIANCTAITGEDQKQLFCKTPPTECSDSLNYCLGEVYANLVSDCLCNGVKTLGTNMNGMPCGPSPTPTSTVVALADCAAMPACPAGNPYLFEFANDRNIYCTPNDVGLTNPCNGPTSSLCEVAATSKALYRICGTGAPGTSAAPWANCGTGVSGTTSFYKTCTTY